MSLRPLAQALSIAFAAAVSAAGSAGCAPVTRLAVPAPTARASVYIGDVIGTDALVAVVTDGDHWVGYVCGGPKTYATLTKWFHGDFARGAAPRLDAHDDRQSLVAVMSDSDVGGTVTIDGVARSFVAARVRSDPLAGLYSTSDNGCKTGFIVRPEGQGPPQGVWCAAPGRIDPLARVYRQVTPIIHPMTRRGLPVLVATNDVSRKLYVLPVIPPLG